MTGSHPEGPEDDGRDPKRLSELARDRVLVTRARDGDPDAYGELVRRHMERAFSIAYGIVRQREDAEDIVQEAFLRTLEHLDRFDPSRHFHPWLYRIVTNQALSHRRARSVRETGPLREDLHESHASDPEWDAVRSELRGHLLGALDALPEQQRTIVVLADVQDMNSREIGEVLQMPAGTVRYHLHLARRALRERLSARTREEQ